jgi:YD repeat-containing protein
MMILPRPDYTYYPAGQAVQEYRILVPGLIESCRDVRFAGPMKNIKYEYLPRDQVHPEAAWGQILAEENLTTGQKVSEIEYPVYNFYQEWDPGWRVEHRPRNVSGAATRRFEYGGGEIGSSTDFQNHASTLSYADAGDQLNYFKYLKDARQNTTTLKKNGNTGALISVTHPPTYPGENSSISYGYSDQHFPYYLVSKSDERAAFPGDSQHTVFYDRDTTRNRIWRVRYPDGGLEQFTYDEGAPNGFNLVTDHLMTSGGTEHFRYDGRGRKTLYWPPPTESDPNPGPNPGQHRTQYFYYDSGINTDRLRQVIDPRGNSTSYEYNGRGQVTKVIHDQDQTHAKLLLRRWHPGLDGRRKPPQRRGGRA